jgi:hypothetical protein
MSQNVGNLGSSQNFCHIPRVTGESLLANGYEFSVPLQRIQLLYRPSMTHQDTTESPNSPINSATSVPAVTTATATTPTPEATVSAFEDPPPKYTPPPSYTTATGARYRVSQVD